MKIAVVGLWHLGSVTAGCLSSLGLNVVAIDNDPILIDNYKHGVLPVAEPGLKKLVDEGIINDLLHFTTDFKEVSTADFIWVAFDTPVDDDDNADVDYVINKCTSFFEYLKSESVVIISSQLPVGSTEQLNSVFAETYLDKTVHFAYSPENLRLGGAIDVFLNPDRIIVGINSESGKNLLKQLIGKITDNVIWMSVASAEMTKHAVNAFLANSIVFINELALICERVGADANQVEKGLKSEARIGPKAYLKPGNAFAGGTLARDISYLIKEQNKLGVSNLFFSSILKANVEHRLWMQNAVLLFFPNVINIPITVLGLTYKPGTDTLRRSQSVIFCEWASKLGAIVNAFDPVVTKLSETINDKINLFSSLDKVLIDAKIIVVATCWPEFRDLNMNLLNNNSATVIDSNGFLEDIVAGYHNIKYIKIGKSNATSK